MVNLPKEKLWDKVNIILGTYGQESLKFSKDYVLEEKIDFKPLREALEYFLGEFFDVLHPALVSLACEAVGGDRSETVKIGAAIVLLAGAADIHDDIMDKSVDKGSKPTVFGKYGQDIAILAGDALLLKGFYLLREGCRNLSKNEEDVIFDSIKRTFFEMSSGVAKEASLRRETTISLDDFLSIVRQKVATVEATMRIGAVIGKGSPKEIDILSHYGRTYGVLLSLRDEFVDVFEVEEVRNRLANECLPLPILLALQEKKRNGQLENILKNEITTENIEKILDLSMDCQSSRDLVDRMKKMIKEEIGNLNYLKVNKEILELLLESTVEDL
ncbi:MAG: polyprenyl synthetase family protein [Candidatus Bathyarchaeia archaeon]|jgi:geranylgeranyl pyrophosphate synthase